MDGRSPGCREAPGDRTRRTGRLVRRLNAKAVLTCGLVCVRRRRAGPGPQPGSPGAAGAGLPDDHLGVRAAPPAGGHRRLVPGPSVRSSRPRTAARGGTTSARCLTPRVDRRAGRDDVPWHRVEESPPGAKGHRGAPPVPVSCATLPERPCTVGRPSGRASAEQFLETWVLKVQASPVLRKDGLVIVTSDRSSPGPRAPPYRAISRAARCIEGRCGPSSHGPPRRWPAVLPRRIRRHPPTAEGCPSPPPSRSATPPEPS
jgi:hypothetical protein